MTETTTLTTCTICDDAPVTFVWTDIHGIGECRECGAPYLIYHYTDDKPPRRVDKPPQCLIKPAWVPIIRRYWEARHSHVCPTGYHLEVTRKRAELQRQLNEWLDRHGDELPTEGAS